MGESQDGSTSAAQGAQADGSEETGPRPGSEPNFLKKILNVFGGAEENAPGGRADAEAAGANGTLVEVFRESGMTRLPVYENTLDTPLGLVHLKDFALAQGFNGTGERYNLKKMLRPLLYVPPSMPIGVLLQKMQSGRMHMALVIDEYGGVDGLVTIEDLIEQVIGEIEDEHDTEDARPFTLEKPGCYLALARTPLDEFEAEIGRKLVDAEDEEEIDTLGGLVFMLAGRVPARGEVIHHPDGPDFEVVDADPRRIKRLRVRLAGAGPGAKPAAAPGAGSA